MISSQMKYSAICSIGLISPKSTFDYNTRTCLCTEKRRYFRNFCLLPVTHIKMVINIIHHVKHRIGRILSHLLPLHLAVKRMESLLPVQATRQKLLRNRLHDGGKQPLLIFETHINRAGAGIGGNGMKGCVQNSLVKRMDK